MNRNEQIAFAVVVATLTVSTAVKIRSINRAGKLERAQIREEAILDLEAIRRAGEVMKTRILNRQYDTGVDVVDALKSEIAFQSIAIREA